MLSATLLLGTGSRTREQVDADLALVGGHLDASVDPQRLSVTGSVLSTGLPVLLEVLADCLTDPAYRRNDVLGERDRLVAHLSIAATQPSTVAHRYLQQRRFGDHPAAWDMPDAERVGAVGVAAVRGLHTRAVLAAGPAYRAAPPARSPRRPPSWAATCWPITGPARCSPSCGCPPRPCRGPIRGTRPSSWPT
jgi:hypothetical protein